MKTDLFINNEWRPAASGKRFAVENPATEENLADVAAGDAADVDNAVRAAKACFESQAWREMSARKRGRILFRAADLLEARLDEVARLETAQNGKTLFESKIEIGMTINTLRYYAGWADKIVGDTLPVEGPFLTYTLREPIGVVGAIVPWNFPLNIASWKFAPALAAGCTVILKPASETPLTALLFAELGLEAGLPAGAFNVVPGGGSTADRLPVVAALPRSWLLHAEQLDVEHQRGVGRDHPAGAARAIAELGRDDQGALAADLHSGDPLVPAADDLPCPQAEGEGLAAVERAVEFGALRAIIVQPAGVMHADLVAFCRLSTGADIGIGVFEAVCELGHFAGCSICRQGRRGYGNKNERR